MQQIETFLSDIKDIFQKDEKLNQMLSDLSLFIDSFGKASSGYSAAGALAKGIGNGNKIEHIPLGLEEYSEFIRSEKKVPWLGWQFKGYEFLEISNKCPFCSADAEKKKQTMVQLKEQYDVKSVEHLNNILKVIEKLSPYFDGETKNRFVELSKKSDKLSKEEIEYLVHVKQQATFLRDKLSSLQSISFFDLKDVDKVVELIKDSKIDINYLEHFKSEHTIELLANISSSIDHVLDVAGQLQAEVNIQKKSIADTILVYSTQINSFLTNAGYKYQVSIDFENNEYHLKLRHNEYNKPIESGDQYLSYGERNALAIVLFMYEAVSKKSDFIILDDPISSFDKNKKYAIIDMLFGKGRGLANKTVMFLTHDLEPIIDLMYTLFRQYRNKVIASFLEIQNGQLIEKEISRNDIKTFTEICEYNIANSKLTIIKLIHLRRLYEISNNKGLPYDLLSNLFHKRDLPYKEVESQIVMLGPDEIEIASDEIRKKVPDFNYTEILRQLNIDIQIKDLYRKATSNFEKLELFRILTAEAVGNSVLRKYINETFHIENDYVMQLNPIKYQVIPYFIIDQCDKELGYI